MTFLPPGRPAQWSGPLREVDRLEWRSGDPGDPGALLADLLQAHGLAGEPASQRGDLAVALLLGAVGCELLAGLAPGLPTPVPAVPEVVAVVVQGSSRPVVGAASGGASVGEWTDSWTEADHAAAVERVRATIARGEVYQANVVGHRSAPYAGDPLALARAVAALPRATYGGVLAGQGWTVGCASPEQLLRVMGDRVTTVPIKGTGRDAAALHASDKDRAEHVMIVDLERNDLARVAQTGSVVVEQLYDVAPWSDLFHASSRVAATLRPGVGLLELLRALAPGGSVTGAPKRAACRVVAEVEAVGRGPAMGALGFVWPGGVDLGLTIRTVALDADRVHLWAGGGITWGSDASSEVAEARAKADPVLRAIAQVRPSAS
ncbi:MAG: Anthranilate synthase [Frankiales bacterium]|nr:Anthranilate synthase [Frankiales bacterium]